MVVLARRPLLWTFAVIGGLAIIQISAATLLRGASGLAGEPEIFLVNKRAFALLTRDAKKRAPVFCAITRQIKRPAPNAETGFLRFAQAAGAIALIGGWREIGSRWPRGRAWPLFAGPLWLALTPATIAAGLAGAAVNALWGGGFVLIEARRVRAQNPGER